MVINKKNALTEELINIACKFRGYDIPAQRAAAHFGKLLDVLEAAEKHISEFETLMINCGKAKKEGVLHPTDYVHKVEKLFQELDLYVYRAREWFKKTNLETGNNIKTDLRHKEEGK